MVYIVIIYLGIQCIGKHISGVHLLQGMCFMQMLFDSFPIRRRKQCACSALDGLLPLQHDFLQIRREAALRLTDVAKEVIHNGIGIGNLRPFCHDVILCQSVFGHEDCHIANNLRGGCYLNDVAQKVIRILIQVLDFLELVGGAHCLNLCQQVGILTAGDFVFIDFRIGCLHFTFKACENLTHALIIMAQLNQLFGIQTGISFCALQRFHNSVHGGLRGQRGHGLDCKVNNIHACLCRHQNGADTVACGIVCMQVQRNVKLFFQCAEQLLRRIGLQQTCHILDCEDVTAHSLQLFCFSDIVIQCIFCFVRV